MWSLIVMDNGREDSAGQIGKTFEPSTNKNTGELWLPIQLEWMDFQSWT
jgi:hypothetical protein